MHKSKMHGFPGMVGLLCVTFATLNANHASAAQDQFQVPRTQVGLKVHTTKVKTARLSPDDRKVVFDWARYYAVRQAWRDRNP